MKVAFMSVLLVLAPALASAEKCYYKVPIKESVVVLPNGKTRTRYEPEVPVGYTWTAVIRTDKKNGKPTKKWALVLVDAEDHTELKKTLEYVGAKSDRDKRGIEKLGKSIDPNFKESSTEATR